MIGKDYIDIIGMDLCNRELRAKKEGERRRGERQERGGGVVRMGS
jgi:hypothetical protein